MALIPSNFKQKLYTESNRVYNTCSLIGVISSKPMIIILIARVLQLFLSPLAHSRKYMYNLKDNLPHNTCQIYRQLRARRALLHINDVLLRTRRALLPLTLYSDNALLVLNGTSLSYNNALLALN